MDSQNFSVARTRMNPSTQRMEKVSKKNPTIYSDTAGESNYEKPTTDEWNARKTTSSYTERFSSNQERVANDSPTTSSSARRNTTGRIATERAHTGKVTTGRIATERTHTGKVTTGRIATERTHTGKVTTGRIPADQTQYCEQDCTTDSASTRNHQTSSIATAAIRTPKPKILRVFTALTVALSVSILVVTGISWSSKKFLDEKITKLHLHFGANNDGATDVLLVGVDSRTDFYGNPLDAHRLRMLHASVDDSPMNTDTIIVVRIPDNGTSATAISIPRDTYVEIPGIGKAKLNSAYGSTREKVLERLVTQGMNRSEAEEIATQKGRQTLITVIQNLTGVSIDHYAEVSLDGFAEFTDSVGGVEVCLNHRVDEPLSGAHFHAGRQLLHGPQALSFVRQRHNLPRGDIDRITRQQVFMASLTHKILSTGVLRHPSSLNQIVNAVHNSIAIDSNWDLFDAASKMSSLASGQVRFATIPIVNLAGWSDDGSQSVVIVDKARVHTWVQSLLGIPENAKNAPVDVYNLGTIEGMATKISDTLVTLGYPRGEVANKQNVDHRTASVVIAPTKSDQANRIAQTLGLPLIIDPAQQGDNISVLITNSYQEATTTIQNPHGKIRRSLVATPSGNSVVPHPINAEKNIPPCVD